MNDAPPPPPLPALPLSVDLEEALATFAAEGFARLGRVASDEVLETLRTRADDLMDGRADGEGLFFQKDAENGEYYDLPFGRGWEGATRRYRKIEQLQRDPVFRAWLGNRTFQQIAQRVLGENVFVLRAMLMTKAAQGGTPLPWHQDAGRFWGVRPDPMLQIWTALDDAPESTGCVEVFPRSHLDGLASPQGGVVPRPIVEARGADARAVPVPVRAGEAILIHNLVWHRSGVNVTAHTRRAFSVCFIDEHTQCTRTRKAPRVFDRAFG